MNVHALQLQEDRALIELRALVANAEKAGSFTDDGKKTYDTLVQSLTDLGTKIEKGKADASFFTALDGLTGGSNSDPRHAGSRYVVSRVGRMRTFGDQYVASDAFAWHAKTKATRSGQWTSESVEIPRAALAYFAALTEDAASGGELVPPDYQRGIVPGPIQPVVVADLIAPGTTGSNVVANMVEQSFVNASAGVAEGTPKPESTITFESVPEPVRKIATWIPVSEELLEDAPAIASYLNTRLSHFVLREEDRQLLFGTGVAPNLLGLLMRPGLAPDIARVDPQNNADAILAQIVTIQNNTGLLASGIVMNPLAFAAIAGLKAADGTYIAAGPFSPIQAPTLWGLPVALTDQITATTALVGAFRTGAQVFRNGGLRVNSTNAHADFFVRNMVAIRAEERLALAVYKNGAFGKVTQLSVVGATVP